MSVQTFTSAATIWLWAMVGCSTVSTPSEARSTQQDEMYTPDAIDPTGSSDVTDELNAFLRSVPDRSQITLSPGARYRVEGVLLFVERHNLTIEGNGATIFARTDGSELAPTSGSVRPLWPRKRQHLRFEGGGGIVIRNLKVQGPHPRGGNGGYVESLEGQHAFAFEGVDGVELDGVTATDVYGDFVYLSMRRGSGQWTRNVWIHDARFERNGRQGITLDAAEDVRIESNYIGDVGRSTIDIEPFSDHGGARRIMIQRNTFGRMMGFVLAAGGRGGNVEDILLAGNQAIGEPFKVMLRAPEGLRRRRIKILDNQSDTPFGSPVALMRFARIDDLEVRGNQNPITHNQGKLGISVLESCDVVVAANTFFPPGLTAGRTNPITEAMIADYTCSGRAD